MEDAGDVDTVEVAEQDVAFVFLNDSQRFDSFVIVFHDFQPEIEVVVPVLKLLSQLALVLKVTLDEELVELLL
jgi:hypothetical protein